MNLKIYLENLSKRIYFQRLPKKRMGAGCLLFDDRGKVLILKPTYKDCWLLPGGAIEAYESPRQACIREVKEETGVDCQPTKLLCVDYVSNYSNDIVESKELTRQSHCIYKMESVQFVFLSKIIDSKTVITVPKQEISTYQFLELGRAIPMLGNNSQRRLQSCLKYLDGEATVYLENGRQR